MTFTCFECGKVIDSMRYTLKKVSEDSYAVYCNHCLSYPARSCILNFVRYLYVG